LAVEAGMILAALLFISRVASTTTVSQVTDEYRRRRTHAHPGRTRTFLTTRTIFRHSWALFFSGATDKVFRRHRRTFTKLPPVVILRLRNMDGGLTLPDYLRWKEVAPKN